ncbi:MAG: Flp family type IVb pilin [Parvularculaceae bacterium]|nr:Flp family type IVb pilin [Parvularculaceae bacterium]
MTAKRTKALRAFWRDESGATAIEYGLIVALVFLAIITSVNQFATNTNSMYSEISSALSQ